MPATITYPGVYVEEEFSLSMSIVAGATAVPVIAVDTRELAVGTGPIRLNSWLDFVALVEDKRKTGVEPNVTPGKTDFTKGLDCSVRAYFQNGGGYCYLLATGSFEAEVPKLDDVTLLVAAGQTIAWSTLVGTGKSRFAILDEGGGTGGVLDANTHPSAASSIHAAVYYPYLQADWAATEVVPPVVPTLTDIPPSAAIAGVYCSVDRERGVWKAPANVALKGGLTPKYRVSDAIQGAFTKVTKPINMIREFRGTGPLVWGARTLKADTDDWNHISVRRLFDAAQRDIKRAMATAMFEPNSSPTWEKVRSAIDNYLHSIWREGGLMGTTPKEAYFVQIGKGVTMTEADINEGIMRVKIGMAAVRPAEFIILQFSQEVAQG